MTLDRAEYHSAVINQDKGTLLKGDIDLIRKDGWSPPSAGLDCDSVLICSIQFADRRVEFLPASIDFAAVVMPQSWWSPSWALVRAAIVACLLRPLKSAKVKSRVEARAFYNSVLFLVETFLPSKPV